MAALEGAGGGVMGGLMGPMLAVMLLYLPTSLVLTAILMLSLQAAFSVGGIYLAAAAVGKVPPTGWLHRLGHVLGSQYQEVTCCTVAIVAPPKGAKANKPDSPGSGRTARRRRSWLSSAIAALVLALSFLVVVGGVGSDLFGAGSTSTARSDTSTGPAGEPVVATVGQDGIRQLSFSLRYPRYEPKLLQAEAGIPLRLTLEAIGEPG